MLYVSGNCFLFTFFMTEIQEPNIDTVFLNHHIEFGVCTTKKYETMAVPLDGLLNDHLI